MKQILFPAILGLCLLAFSFCRKHDDTRSVSGDAAVLSWQECALFPDYDLTICFTGANEARCPCNMECFWEGVVDFTLKVQGPGVDTTVTLTTNSNPLNLPHQITLGNTTIDVEDASGLGCADYGVYDKYKVRVRLSR